MLLGASRCTVDGRGRLTIPAQLCAELAEGLTVTRGIERCLFVYPTEEWQGFTKKIHHRLPLTSPDARAFARLLFSGALICTLDQHGRIPLPSHLRRYAGIEKRAIVVGLGTHLEVWSPRRWQEMREQIVKEGTAVAERLSHLGI